LVEGNQTEEQAEWWKEQKNRIGMSIQTRNIDEELG
jgi:hypothetical protein